MGKKIVGIIQPFDIHQNFYVYENGNKLEIMKPKLEEMIDTIFAFSNKFEVNQVDLVGPKQYLKGFTKQIKAEEVKRYNKEKLEINIV